MFKALLKKQLCEMLAGFTLSRKTGKRRKTIGIVLYALLMVFLFAVLALAFAALSATLAEVFAGTDRNWLYFGILGSLAFILSLFGSVFTAYSHIYLAKDNELLLSMPIPPRKILYARMSGLYLTAFLFTLIVMLPASIVFWMKVRAGVTQIVFPILMMFLLPLTSMALSCLIGWIVALIAAKLKSRTASRLLIAFVFIGAYYLLYGKISAFFEEITRYALQLENAFKSGLYPVYAFGRACTGDVLCMLLFALGCAAVAVLCMFILSRTFIGFSTAKATGAKKVYREKAVRAVSADRALFRREWKRYAASATYILNASLGTFMMPIGAIAFLFVMKTVRAVLDVMPVPAGFLEVIIMGLTGILISMNNISTPSVSLEGKSLWIAQSLPVSAWQALRAKLRLHCLMTYPALIPLVILLSYAAHIEFVNVVLMFVFFAAYVLFFAELGLMLGLARPMLNWTNETTAVKQNTTILITIFSGIILSGAIGFAGWFAVKIMSGTLFITLGIVLFGALAFIMLRLLKTKGANIYAHLG